MSVSHLNDIQVPPPVAAWIDPILVVFLGLVLLWMVLKVAGFFMRRAYNLTPVTTAASKDVRPDFLKVDHAAREQLIERGRPFDGMQAGSLKKALSVTGVGVIVSAFVSFGSAAFLAFGRVEELESTWRNYSGRERFGAIVHTHPVGFTIALAMTVGALVRFVMTVRRAR